MRTLDTLRSEAAPFDAITVCRGLEIVKAFVGVIPDDASDDDTEAHNMFVVLIEKAQEFLRGETEI